MTPLKVLLLHDGVPGHLNQARGLVQLLAEHRALQVRELKAKLRWRWSRRLLRRLCQLSNARAQALVETAYRLQGVGVSKISDTELVPDVIISFGGNIAPLNVALSQRFACNNILMGSLRGIAPHHCTAHLSLQGGCHANAVATGIAPSLMTPSACKEAADAWRQQHVNDLGGPLWCCLVGGDGSGFRYRERDWQRLAQGMNALAARHGIRWLLATSRRTGELGEATLQRWLQPGVIAHSIYFGQQGNQSLAPLLGASEQIFCTADSMSMLSEAMASGRSVTALLPEQVNAPPAYRGALTAYEARGYLHVQPLQSLEQGQTPSVGLSVDVEDVRLSIVDKLRQLSVLPETLQD